MVKKYATLFVIGVMMLGMFIASSSQAAFAQGVAYSCGTYSADNYSGNGCKVVKPPHTNLSKTVTQPKFIIPAAIFGLMIIVAATALIVLKRRKQKT